MILSDIMSTDLANLSKTVRDVENITRQLTKTVFTFLTVTLTFIER